MLSGLLLKAMLFWEVLELQAGLAWLPHSQLPHISALSCVRVMQPLLDPHLL